MARTDKQYIELISTLLGEGRETLRSSWPVENNNGRVKLADRNASGVTLREHLAPELLKHGTPPGDIDRVVALFNAHIDQFNERTKLIANNTSITSRPEIAMVVPDGAKTKNAYWTLAQYILKNQLEASGAKVTALDQAGDRYVRDHYLLGSNSVAQPLAVTALNSTGDDAAADSRNSGVARTINSLGKLGVATADIAGGSLAFSINKALTGFNRKVRFDPRGDERTVGGDVLQHPQSNTVFIGVNLDASGKPDADQLKAAQALSKSLNMKLVTVPKAQQKPFYHLDTFMSVLPDGSVVLLPDATTPQARDAIRTAIKGHDMLELPVKAGESQSQANDRRSFATNIVTVNGNSFTGNAIPELKAFMADRGLTLIEGPFVWGMSGPHCQTNFIKRGKVDGRSDVASLALEGLPQLAYADIPQSVPQLSPNIATKPVHDTPQLG